MAKKKIGLSVVTPTEIKVDKEDVDMVIMRCIDGDMGVLPGHAMYATALDEGILRIIDEDKERYLAVYGGFARIEDDQLTIVTGGAEWPEDIDQNRAERDRKAAEILLQDQANDMDVRRAQLMLRRSLVRIEVSSYPLIMDLHKKE